MFQNFKRLFLALMTLVAVSTMVSSLVASWQQPQIQSRLELYQINLLLQASQWQPASSDLASDLGLKANNNWQQLRGVILGEEPIKIAQEQYQNARRADQKILDELTKELSQPETNETGKSATTGAVDSQSDKIISQLEEVIPQLDIALGILDMELGNRQTARETWQKLLDSQPNSQIKPQPNSQPKVTKTTQATAKILLNLWSDRPPSEIKIEPKLTSKSTPTSQEWEGIIKTSLTSWFRDRALHQLYTLENSPAKLQALQQQENSQAENAVWRLLALTIIPSVSGLLGLGLIIFLGGQAIIKGRRSLLFSDGNISETDISGDDLSNSLSESISGINFEVNSGVNSGISSETSSEISSEISSGIKNQTSNQVLVVPWGGETIWEVLVGGFFFVGQLLIPYIFSNLSLGSLNLDVRGKAIAVLASYVCMSIGTLTVLYFALRRFLPLPPGWFPLKWRGKWILWGVGGYLVAIPLVIGISLVNQVIWQGKGGSNPILPLALQGNDLWSFLIFAATASIAAPIFEEIIFRGFLLPSLTRYLPVWGAIAASSLLFAIAHLSLSEVLPLTVLGMVLGVVYWQCPAGGSAPKGNLLASMLLHSLWNGGTLISLYILSSGGN
jgi:uncharacterized protein